MNRLKKFNSIKKAFLNDRNIYKKVKCFSSIYTILIVLFVPRCFRSKINADRAWIILQNTQDSSINMKKSLKMIIYLRV